MSPDGHARWAAVAAVVTLCGLVTPVVAQAQPPSRQQFALSVLSSRPDQVSGGDALVRVDVPRTVPLAPGDASRATARTSRTASRRRPTDEPSIGLVDGIRRRRQRARGAPNGRGRGRPDPARSELVNHPIEGPIFSGPHQQPFVCTTARANFDGRKLLGQPIVDNQDRFGIPVAAEDAAGNYPRTGAATRRAARTIVGLEQELLRADPGRLRLPGRPAGSSAGSTTRRGAAARRRRRPRRWTARPCRTSCAGSAARSTASSTASPCWRPSPRPTRSARRLAVERPAGLQPPGRRRHRPHAGHDQRRRDAAASPCWSSATRSSTRPGCARTPTTTCSWAARRRSC